ncbi:hypothetical protein OROGR_018222 [Orobanche gracilis]
MKSCSEKKRRREVDRFSSLPDEIICHILSFLLTKEVVGTNILSKRWYPLWRSVPVIDFTNKYQLSTINGTVYLRFIYILSKVLLFRDNIERFSLTLDKCPHHQNINQIYNLIDFVLGRGVQQLELDFDFPKSFPMGVFRCNTLVYLKLDGFDKINVISYVELPSLKILHLGYIQFAQDSCLLQLLSGCPNLEDFEALTVFIDHHSCQEFKTLTNLIRAYVVFCETEFVLDVLNNVEFLRMHISLEIFSKYRWQWFVQMLKHCPKLRNLRITENCMSGIDNENWVCPTFVPECVSLCVRECTILEYKGDKDEVLFARYIMENARVLQTLRIHFDLELGSNTKLKAKKKLLLCKKKHLATCNLSFN